VEAGPVATLRAVSVAQVTARTPRVEFAARALTRARPSLRELLIALAIFAVAGVAVFGSHVVDGGFYYDDWANSAKTHFAGDFGAQLSSYWDLTRWRPLLVVYVPALNSIFGTHQHLFLAWSLLTAILATTALFALLRTLGFERLHAGLISLLTLVFPFADVTRFWATSSVTQVVIALYFIGLTVALRGIDAPTRRSRVRHHAVALVFYAASVALYETAATVILASVLVYWWRASRGAGWRAGLRRALPRFGADVLVVGALLVWNISQSKITSSSESGGILEHVRLILDQGWQIIASAALPFGTPRTATVLLAAGAILAAGVLVAVLLRRMADDEARRELWRWTATAGAGVLFAFVAWGVFAPAAAYYSPGTIGLGNRVNAVASAGIVVAVYAVAMVAGTLVFRGLTRWRIWAAGLAAVAAIALGVGYIQRVDDDKTAWAAATREQLHVERAVRQAVPRPPRGATLFTFGEPGWAASGVPIFAATWDLQGAVRMLYGDKTLDGQPVIPPMSMVCTAKGLYFNGLGYGPASARPYGLAVLVDVPAGTAVRPMNRGQCQRAAGRYPVGPYALPTT
jgi:hypothetical protein